MKRLTTLVISLLMTSAIVWAQSGMTDNQVMDYVIEQNSKGVSRQQIVTQLMQRGVNIEQIRRIQKKYEKQEVLLNPDTQDTLETFRWLNSILTKEICFYAKRGFNYVSKANTNAKGFDHIQIGGVFTVKRFRNQGYALHTVAALCRHIIEEEHKIPSLFVRCDNEYAIKLYKNLGFEIKDTKKTVYLN